MKKENTSERFESDVRILIENKKLDLKIEKLPNGQYSDPFVDLAYQTFMAGVCFMGEDVVDHTVDSFGKPKQ